MFSTKEESLTQAYENTKWQIPSESLPGVIHLILADASGAVTRVFTHCNIVPCWYIVVYYSNIVL
jgi:hypothetical protein